MHARSRSPALTAQTLPLCSGLLLAEHGKRPAEHGNAGRGFDVFCKTVGWLFSLCCSYGTPAASSSRSSRHIPRVLARATPRTRVPAASLVPRAGGVLATDWSQLSRSRRQCAAAGTSKVGPPPTRLFLSPVALAERAPSFSGPVTLVLREARLGRPQPGRVVGGSQRDRRRQCRLPPLLLLISQPHQLVQPIAQPRVHVASAMRCGAAEGGEQLRVGCTSRSDTLHKRSHD